MTFTKEQVEAQNRKFPVPGSMRTGGCILTRATVQATTKEDFGDLTEKVIEKMINPWGDMNKTEREFLNGFLLSQPTVWSHIDREAFKIRIGPPKKRCDYTPDFSGLHKGRFALIEVKGAFEREDSRRARMAAARWCLDRKIGFLFAQKTKAGWQQTWLA